MAGYSHRARTHTHTHTHTDTHSKVVYTQRHDARATHAQTPSSQMTVQRRGESELIEMNCVASTSVAARHRWRIPGSPCPHLQVFIPPTHGQLSPPSIYVRELPSHPSLPPSLFLLWLVCIIFSLEQNGIFQSALQSTGLYQRRCML